MKGDRSNATADDVPALQAAASRFSRGQLGPWHERLCGFTRACETCRALIYPGEPHAQQAGAAHCIGHFRDVARAQLAAAAQRSARLAARRKNRRAA